MTLSVFEILTKQNQIQNFRTIIYLEFANSLGVLGTGRAAVSRPRTGATALERSSAQLQTGERSSASCRDLNLWEHKERC